MPNYSNQKRAKTDFCNICGQLTDLTWDHVPPQSCMNSFPVRFNQIMDGLPHFNKYKAISQNGIRFRSICPFCNNELLGREYDPELAKYTTSVVEFLKATITQHPSNVINIADFPSLECNIKINRLTRAVCGHILAAKNEYDLSVSDQRIRDFFLNSSVKPPEGFHLLMWFYPYSTITIARDFVAKNVLSTKYPLPEGMCSILSSFPIAYILCDGEYCGHLPDLFAYCTNNIDDDTVIPMDFSSCMLESGVLRHPVWPLFVSDDPGGVDMVLASKHTTDSSVIGMRNLHI